VPNGKIERGVQEPPNEYEVRAPPNQNSLSKVKFEMKLRNRHAEAKPRLPKIKKKPARRAKAKTLHGITLTAPIFNTPLAGKVSKYIRPFDPVWPTEEED
jgi:hypothetical protein